MRVHAQIAVGEIAAATPHTTKVFDALGIDYVMHGNLSLRDACAEAGVDLSMVKDAIEKMPPVEGERNWADASMKQVLDELEHHRHPVLRAMLGEAATAIAAVSRGSRGIEPVRDAFTALCDTLQPHMIREEHVIFPVIQHVEDCWTRNERLSMNFVGGATVPIAALVADHSRIVDLVVKLSDASKRLEGKDARASRARDAVAALVHEVRDHIHLENNVLYPRAAALQAAVLAGT